MITWVGNTDGGLLTSHTTLFGLPAFMKNIPLHVKEKICPSKVLVSWRIKNNEQLDKLIKHENIVNYIIAQRLSWFGHIQRMPEARATKKIFKWNPLTTRPRGRPKYRWEDNILQDLVQIEDKKLVNLCPG